MDPATYEYRPFGRLIQQHRKKYKLTQTAFAAMLGIERSHLSRIECGSKQMQPQMLKTVADIFHLNLTDLKREFYSDRIVQQVMQNTYPASVLKIAQAKIAHLQRAAK